MHDFSTFSAVSNWHGARTTLVCNHGEHHERIHQHRPRPPRSTAATTTSQHAKAALQSDAFGTDTTSSASATSGTAARSPAQPRRPPRACKTSRPNSSPSCSAPRLIRRAGQAPTAGTGANGQTAAAATDPTVDSGQSASQGSPIRHLAGPLAGPAGRRGRIQPGLRLHHVRARSRTCNPCSAPCSRRCSRGLLPTAARRPRPRRP